MFGTFAYIGILTLLWLVNLFTGTGLDMVYRVTEKTMYLVNIMFILIYGMKKNKENFDRQYGRSEKKGYELDKK